MPYDADSRDPRVHITNKFVQTGWESVSEEGRELDDIERLAHDWPPYAALLEAEIIPLVADLADAVAPLISSGQKAVASAAASAASAASAAASAAAAAAAAAATAASASASKRTRSPLPPCASKDATEAPAPDLSAHFELFACDLVVATDGRVYLMEVRAPVPFAASSPHPDLLPRLFLLPIPRPPPRAHSPPRGVACR